MGEMADDMYDAWERMSSWDICPKHRQPIDHEWGCSECESEAEADGHHPDSPSSIPTTESGESQP